MRPGKNNFLNALNRQLVKIQCPELGLQSKCMVPKSPVQTNCGGHFASCKGKQVEPQADHPLSMGAVVDCHVFSRRPVLF